MAKRRQQNIDANLGLSGLAGEANSSSARAGAHERGTLGVAGPPQARHSIATGKLVTKSQQAEALAREAEQAYPEDFPQQYDGTGMGYGWSADGTWTADGYYNGYDNQPWPAETGTPQWNADGWYAGSDAGYGSWGTGGYAGQLDAGGYGYDGYTDGYPGVYPEGGNGGDGYPGYGPEVGFGYDDGDDGAFSSGEPWADESYGDVQPAGRGLIGRLKRRNDAPAPAPWVMTGEDKLDAEAWARANAYDQVDLYEHGYQAVYGVPGTVNAGEGQAAGVGVASGGIGFGGGRRSSVPAGGMGVQVQVPTARMEKSLSLSTNVAHQRHVDAGTGGRLVATLSGMRHAGKTSGGGMHFATDKEVLKSYRKRLLTILLIIACVLVAAAIGAVIGYFISLSNRLGLDDIDQVQATLTEPGEGEPYYVLFVADLNDNDGSNDDLDAILLARMDETNKKVTLVALPGDIEVVLSDFDYHPATMARADGGNARLITSLSDLLDVPIAHFVQTDANGLATIVDAIGGVDMTLTQEIDDPQAGSQYLPAGEHHLDGQTALEVLRADNFHESEEARGQNRCTFSTLLVQKILGSGFLTFANITDIIAGNVSTDYTAREILALAQAMSGLTVADVMAGVAPGSQETSTDGTQVYSPDYTELASMMELVEAGLSPVIEHNQGQNVNPADVSVTVWNGSGVPGGAAILGDMLTEAGFNVVEVTNAKAYVYDETLIIYDDDDDLEAAYAVENALGQGRIIDGTWKYTFETDILVVLGSEWK